MVKAPSEQRARLSIDVAPEPRRRLKIAAASRDLTVREYVETTLRRALEAEERGAVNAPEPTAWSQLSACAFARDWESDEAKLYNRLG